MKLFSIRELFKPIVCKKQQQQQTNKQTKTKQNKKTKETKTKTKTKIQNKTKKHDRFLLSLKQFYWETNLWVMLGDFTVK